MPKTGAQIEDYEVQATIGTGTYGICKKVRRKSDGKVFVWKEIDYRGMSEREKQLLVQEVNLLRELRHPHIVRYHDRVISRSRSTLFIIMEYCEGGDLAALIVRRRQERTLLEEEFVWRVFLQLLLALQECYKQRQGVHKVLHRDLKPANVFLDCQGQVKLGDFGMARILHHNFSLAHTFVGTPYYMSPELLKEQSYDEKSDLWSLGCLLYELCALEPPFTAPNRKVLEARIKLGTFKRIPAHYSTGLHDSIALLLQSQPAKRPDIPMMLKQIKPYVAMGTAEKQAPVSAASPDELSTREARLEAKQAAIAKKELELQAKEMELSQWEKHLAVWEKVLLEKERQLRKKSSLHHHPH